MTTVCKHGPILYGTTCINCEREREQSPQVFCVDCGCDATQSRCCNGDGKVRCSDCAVKEYYRHAYGLRLQGHFIAYRPAVSLDDLGLEIRAASGLVDLERLQSKVHDLRKAGQINCTDYVKALECIQSKINRLTP